MLLLIGHSWRGCCLTESTSGTVPERALCRLAHGHRALLFRDFLLPFEVTSVLILIAIMGAVVLASPADDDGRTGAGARWSRSPTIWC